MNAFGGDDLGVNFILCSGGDFERTLGSLGMQKQ